MTGRLQPGDPDYRPARGHKWRDAWPGNQLARKHGVWASDVADEAREVVGWLYDPADVERYPAMALVGAEVWVRWRRAVADIERRGDTLEDDRENPCVGIAERCEKKLLDLSARFGLDPKSEADLAKSRATASLSGFDLQAAIAAGRQVIDATAIDDEDNDDAA